MNISPKLLIHMKR